MIDAGPRLEVGHVEHLGVGAYGLRGYRIHLHIPKAAATPPITISLQSSTHPKDRWVGVEGVRLRAPVLIRAVLPEHHERNVQIV